MRGSVFDRAGADSDAVKIEVVAGRALKGGDITSNKSCIQDLLFGSRGLLRATSTGKGRGKRKKGKRNDQSAEGARIILAIRGQKLWIIYFFRESRTKARWEKSDLESPGASKAFVELLQATGRESFRGLCGRMGVWICIVLHTAYTMYHTSSLTLLTLLTLASLSLTL